MNPYVLVAALLAMAAAGWGGFSLGVDHEKANQADQKELMAAVADEATNAMAKAVGALRPKYTTIQSEVQREIKTNTVFADCKLPAASLRLINQALDPRADASAAADGGELPGADAAVR